MTGSLGASNLPIRDRWLEDYVAGPVYELGHRTLSETEILTFARR